MLSAVDILGKLVAFESTSNLSNLPITAWIEDFSKQYGAQCQRIYNAEKTKANLLVRFGPQVEGGVIVSGHTDIVPVEGQEWHTNPYELSRQGDVVIARGACDMKGALACALTVVQNLGELQKPLYLAFSYDEEVGCVGVQSMIDYFIKHEPNPLMAVIIEPTNLTPLIAHKGINVYQTKIKGKPQHSSQTDKGVSAVSLAGELLHWQTQKAQQLAKKRSELPFNPPYTTIHSGMVNGGTAVNIMAEHASLFWEIRQPPQEEALPIQQEFEAYASALIAQFAEKGLPVRIDTHIISQVPSYQTDTIAFDNISTIVEQGIRQQSVTKQLPYVAFATEAGLFQQSGIASVVCGPGDPLQAHQPNESISLQQLDLGVEFLKQVVALNLTSLKK